MTQFSIFLVFSLLAVNSTLGTSLPKEPSHPDPSVPGTDTSWKDPDPDLTAPHSSRVKRDDAGEELVPLNTQKESTTNAPGNATSLPDLSMPNANQTSEGLTGASTIIVDPKPPPKVTTPAAEENPSMVDIVMPMAPPPTAPDNDLERDDFFYKFHELHKEMVERCKIAFEYEGFCYNGDRCKSKVFRSDPHELFFKSGYNAMTFRPEHLDDCDLIAKIEPTDREAHFSLELETTGKDLGLPLVIEEHGDVTFRVVNGRLTCAPNCTMNATKPLISYVDTANNESFYFFKTDYFLWKNKKRADLKWCLQQFPCTCHVGQFCTTESPFKKHGQNIFVHDKLRRKILVNPALKKAAENCNVGAVMKSTDDKGRSLFDYHTTVANALNPILPTYHRIKHPISVGDNDTLVCGEPFCTVNTFYNTSYTENGVKYLFFTGELITTVEKPDKGNATGLAKGEKEKTEQFEARPAYGIIFLIGIFILLAVIVLVVVSVTMYQRYQKAKTKHREALIQARIKPEPARSSRKELTPLVKETDEDMISEKSALDRSFKD